MREIKITDKVDVPIILEFIKFIKEAEKKIDKYELEREENRAKMWAYIKNNCGFDIGKNSVFIDDTEKEIIIKVAEDDEEGKKLMFDQMKDAFEHVLKHDFPGLKALMKEQGEDE